MGYFDGLTDSSFKTDSQGRTVFYPRGILGKGYILKDEQQHQKFRRYLKVMYMIMLPVIIGIQIVFGVIPNLVLLPCYIIWYRFQSKKMVEGLEVSGERLSRKETMTNSARSHNLPTLIILALCSYLFVIAGLWMLATAPDTGEKLIALFCLAFFGFCALAITKMAYLKIRKK